MTQALAIIAVVLVVLAGLAGANFLYDRGAPDRIPRRYAHVLCGVAFFIAVLWLGAGTAIALAGLLAVLVLALRLGHRRSLRGVSRSDSTKDWAEVAFPVAIAVSLAVGWGVLGDRWLAFLPAAFVAWGDSVAGLVRAIVLRGRVAIVLPSIAMLGVCLIVAVLFQPFWIGAIGALVATAAERFRQIAHRLWEDNWVPDDPVIVAASLAVMAILAAVMT